MLNSFDIVHQFYGFDSLLPEDRDLDEKRNLYKFTTSDGFPPHLETIQNPDKATDIFNVKRLLNTQALLQATLTEQSISGAPGADENTISGIEQRSRELLAEGAGVQDVPNISERTDWYSDAIFAQQFFTGPNPMIVKKATSWHLDIFRGAAEAQNNEAAVELLNDQSGVELWVADYSYFREAAGLSPEDPITTNQSQFPNQPTRFGCASIVLFHLSCEGQIHPSAIVLDYKGQGAKSVTVFNKRLRSTDCLPDDREGWPWRYAKTCAMTADWVDHELRVHLTEAHFIDEATIVAVQRSFEDAHPICELLQPHWVRTLSLNALARSMLVPTVILNIGPFNKDQALKLINYYFKKFNWKNRYIPAELPSRGFPVHDLENGNKTFRNYTYGRNMVELWPVLQKYVSDFLHAHAKTHPQYETDRGVKNDYNIKLWHEEMTSADKANITGFPRIQTRCELVDALAACIFIASPQHNAINYLQNYYMAFVINKPPSIYAPLPQNLEELEAYNEQSLISALPTGRDRVRQWLLASHLPWLLSYQTADKLTLLSYACSVAEIEGPAQKAGQYLVEALKGLETKFVINSQDLHVVTEDTTHKLVYDVMSPGKTAVSILL